MSQEFVSEADVQERRIAARAAINSFDYTFLPTTQSRSDNYAVTQQAGNRKERRKKNAEAYRKFRKSDLFRNSNGW